MFVIFLIENVRKTDLVVQCSEEEIATDDEVLVDHELSPGANEGSRGDSEKSETERKSKRKLESKTNTDPSKRPRTARVDSDSVVSNRSDKHGKDDTQCQEAVPSETKRRTSGWVTVAKERNDVEKKVSYVRLYCAYSELLRRMRIMMHML